MRTEPTTGVTTQPGTATCLLHEETYDHPDGSCPRCPSVRLDDGTTVPAADHLARDRGDAPCSRYGRHADQWQPVALATYRVLTEVHGAEPSTDTLDYVSSLVVNDSDDVAYTLVNDAELIGLDWADYVDGERVQCGACEAFDLRTWEEDICTNCHAMLPIPCAYCDAPATHHGEGEPVCETHIYPAAADEYHPLGA